KGRFDEIFFVDLPVKEIRKRIFDIHLKKRGYENAGIDADLLADNTDGFSGAEIEQVIVSALYTAFSSYSKLNTQILSDEIKKTSPLSKMRAEQISQLRNWAKGRTASAN
ncbi:MAG: ATPase, partial [Candidatus Delongbacteria bacterium]|nr:ATPase [Candidatus Delongbacteria bacterium]